MLNVLVGFTDTDTEEDIKYCVRKIVNLRVFEDENDVMNRSVIDEKSYTSDVMMNDKIATNKVLPKFFPTRKKFLKFLRLFRKQENPDMWNRLFNVAYRADTLVRNYNDGHRQSYTRDKLGKCDQPEYSTLACGHTVPYAAYIDSQHCVICDKEAVSAFEV